MPNLDLKMESWLSLNDISHHKNLQTLAPLKLATSEKNVVSNGIFTGRNLLDARNADSNVEQALQNYGRYSDQVKAAAQMAPTTGLTTILDIARIVSNFNPALPDDPNNVPAYNNYVTKILQNPLMHLLTSDHKNFNRKTSDWNEAIDQIAGLYDGISASDKGKIVASLKTLAKAASSSSSTKQTQSLFTQSTVNCDDNIDIYIYSSTVTMEEKSSGKHDVKQVSFDILATQIRFTKELWSTYSDKVLAKHIALMDDWLNGIDTNPNPVKSTLTCLT